jgi:hypothetical protein
MKDVAHTVMSQKDIEKNKILRETAQQRADAAVERNRISMWKATLQQRKLNSDERREILKAQSKNETDRLKLDIAITRIQKDLKEKAGKVDPNTLRPLITEDETTAMFDRLEELKTNMSELKDINMDYEGLLVEKGGTRTNQNRDPGQRRPLSSFER